MTYCCAKQNSSFAAGFCSAVSARAFNLISAVLDTVLAVSIIICLIGIIAGLSIIAVRVSLSLSILVLVLVLILRAFKTSYSPSRWN